jgi:D-alanyl-D-alanine carboxypeptidase (penicillin-binding protein 5/6)
MRAALAGLALAAAALAAPLYAAENPYPDLAAAYLVQAEGRTLWANAVGKRLPPASLTKIMTALLVLERGGLQDSTTISKRAAAATGARLRLAAGSRVGVGDLLVATLVGSANDACRALAEWHSGSESRFVAAMNERARALGLRDTHFQNACGFDGARHYSSAEDLARLAEAAMANERFRAIVALREAVVRTADGSRTYRVETTNALLGRLPGAIGIKSGHTRKAGRCIVALAERGGRRVLLVMLGAANRWWDAHDVIERAFAAGAR